jgi:hypothetical protein
MAERCLATAEPSITHIGAGNQVRTGDLNLGKVALYQLSYSRAIVLTNPFEYGY